MCVCCQKIAKLLVRHVAPRLHLGREASETKLTKPNPWSPIIRTSHFNDGFKIVSLLHFALWKQSTFDYCARDDWNFSCVRIILECAKRITFQHLTISIRFIYVWVKDIFELYLHKWRLKRQNFFLQNMDHNVCVGEKRQSLMTNWRKSPIMWS
jgi:hypothetical protein